MAWLVFFCVLFCFSPVAAFVTAGVCGVVFIILVIVHEEFLK